MRMNNWGLVKYPDPYRAPELLPTVFQGTVEDHPKHVPGKKIATSEPLVIDLVTMVVTTSSGSRYELGPADPAWLQLAGVASAREGIELYIAKNHFPNTTIIR